MQSWIKVVKYFETCRKQPFENTRADWLKIVFQRKICRPAFLLWCHGLTSPKPPRFLTKLKKKSRWLKRREEKTIPVFILVSLSISWTQEDSFKQIQICIYLSRYTLLNYTEHLLVKSNLFHPAKQFVSNNLFGATCKRTFI